MAPLPPVEILKDDYGRTLDVFKMLVDIRFRLLALVPTVSGAAIGLLGKGDLGGTGVAVAALGLVATAGIVVYEIRNSQLHDATVHRLKFLEALMELPSSTNLPVGGIASERPSRPALLFGLVPLWHDLALSIVYGASIGGWVWLLTQSITVTGTVGAGPNIAASLGVVIGVSSAFTVQRMSRVGRPQGRVLLLPERPNLSSSSGPVALMWLTEIVSVAARPTWVGTNLVDAVRANVNLSGEQAAVDARDWYELAHQLGIVEKRSRRHPYPWPAPRAFVEVEAGKRTWIRVSALGKGLRATEQADRQRALRQIVLCKVVLLREVLALVTVNTVTVDGTTIPNLGFAPWLDQAQVDRRLAWAAELDISRNAATG